VEPDEVRAAVRRWLAGAWDPDLSLVEWRRRLVAVRWAVPSWPPDRHGRGLPPWSEAVVAEELERAGAPGLPPGAGTSLAAPTLLAHAGDELQARLLERILTGEDRWCQLFSEPGTGSDLAGLSTTATLDGDEWTAHGQKLWSTSAHHADLGLLLARTDWEAPKHRGITCFALPMRQAGVEARPVRQMNGHSSFNEVFLAGARIPSTHVIGDPGQGWRVAMTTLAHERGFATMRPRHGDRGAPRGRALEEAEREAAEHERTYEWYPQRAGRVDLVLARAGAAGGDAATRDAVARLVALQRSQQWTAQRARAARRDGRAPGAEGSIGKLGASLVARAAAGAHSRLAGGAAMLAPPDAAGDDAVVAEVLVSVPAQSIAGGTDEIQRTILGEQVLGLPREPAVDRDVPFRTVRRT